MDARRVKQLSDLVASVTPEQGDQTNLYAEAGLQDAAVSRFILTYRDTRFAWRAMQTLVRHGVGFPPWLTGEDTILFRAYCYLWNPKKFPDAAVQQALAFLSNSMRNDRAVIDGLLLSSESTFSKIANITGFDETAIRVYEKCFFNVVDRRRDAAYLKNIVYPDGKSVELVEGYLKNEDFGMMLRRAGYNHGIDDVLYFAGFPEGLARAVTTSGIPGRFESVMMANGYMLARNGFAHQAGMPAVRAATGLLAAAKAGGDTMDNNDLIDSTSNIFINEISTIASQRKMRTVTPDSGEISDGAATIELPVYKVPEKS